MLWLMNYDGHEGEAISSDQNFSIIFFDLQNKIYYHYLYIMELTLHILCKNQFFNSSVSRMVIRKQYEVNKTKLINLILIKNYSKFTIDHYTYLI
jgi:hypothetical protein